MEALVSSKGIDWWTLIYFLLITGLPRTFFMFAMLPMFSSSMIPVSVHRNAVVFAVMLLLLPNFFNQLDRNFPQVFTEYQMIALLLKEIFIGFLIGFLFSLPFLAIQGVGFIFDNQRGSSIDSTFNPTNESETTTMGNLFNLFFMAFFFVSGLFMQMLGIYYHSFEIWPIFEFWPTIDTKLVTFALAQLGYLLDTAVILAGPVLLVMFLCEFSLALTNKFAQQLNVFILSLPIKSGVGFFIMTLYVPLLADYFEHKMFDLADFFAQISWVLGG